MAPGNAQSELRPTFDGGSRCKSIAIQHVGVQRITAARSVEARFLWKRFCRSRN